MSNLAPVWMISGCSTGLGHALAKAVLAAGNRAILTARRPETLADLAARYPETALAVELDVTKPQTITSAVTKAQQHFGRIDVLVNNAGYGYLAAIEEGDDAEIRDQFETNVFGVINLTKAVLPLMRAQKSGHIINISSIGGLVAFGATGYYHATKFALEALSESLWHETAPLGINVTIVEPGPFRTDWAGRSMIAAKTIIDDYAETAGKRRESTFAASGQQPGDPDRAAQAIITAVQAPNPPLRLLLGTLAYDIAIKRLTALRDNFDQWRDLTLSTDFQ
ncbi:oxidoreductase [Thalassospira marina]|uniref:Short-chain dehydrogenase/reductase n=1 Tax=Thalassospira marina TaxID=2048283 RepID=A0ABM6Q7D3_9PROT|nr:oxidoreductase [Thalassospira marina]AUG52414.1 short-chain dehydrogenase/reductase [Thalassospira marina]